MYKRKKTIEEIKEDYKNCIDLHYLYWDTMYDRLILEDWNHPVITNEKQIKEIEEEHPELIEYGDELRKEHEEEIENGMNYMAEKYHLDDMTDMELYLFFKNDYGYKLEDNKRLYNYILLYMSRRRGKNYMELYKEHQVVIKKNEKFLNFLTFFIIDVIIVAVVYLLKWIF